MFLHLHRKQLHYVHSESYSGLRKRVVFFVMVNYTGLDTAHLCYHTQRHALFHHNLLALQIIVINIILSNDYTG